MMELAYKNKKSIDDILKTAAKYDFATEYADRSMLINGDNFIVMAGLLKNYSNKVDLVYIDPPFNTSNEFYISDARANTISASRDSEIAYTDKMTKEEFLEFLRERLVLIKELMSEQGSIYLHINYKIGHYVKIIMDEIFGEQNFKNDITRVKSNPKNFLRKAYGNEKDLILFYAKDGKNNIWNDLRIKLDDEEIAEKFKKTELSGRKYTTIPLHAPGETQNGITGCPWRGIPVPEGRHWRTNPEEFDRLDREGRIEWSSNGNPRIKKYADEHKGKRIQDIWTFKDPQYPVYPTEKNHDMLKRIILQSSKSDSIVMDCFAGSGSTLEQANLLGRKWIGVDNSPAAIKIIKQRNLGDYLYIDMKNTVKEI